MRLRYIGLLAGVFVVAVWASWKFGAEVDNSSYDEFFRLYEPPSWQAQSIILAIDEPTLLAAGGMLHIRGPLARAVRRVSAASPRVIALDVILADAGDPAETQELSDALREAPNLVLSCELIDDPLRWEDPRPELSRWAVALGHVYAQPDDRDQVMRAIPLEKRAGTVQRWALALQAFRLSRGAAIIESPTDLAVGHTTIPVKRTSDGRIMRVRYRPPGKRIPRVSVDRLLSDSRAAEQFAGKVVFIGVTAASEGDRYLTPYAFGDTTPGVEIHASAFETLTQGLFLTDAPASWVVLSSLALVIVAGLGFRYLTGWKAYAAAVAILLISWFAPYLFFAHRIVYSVATSAGPVTACIIAAAVWQSLVVRRNLVEAESDRARYQQAMHFVTHEMRTPLSAIQGSSELISRYALTDEKRKQIADLINSESKRLARMIEVFLNVERLSAGEMELRREEIPLRALVETCLDRARPLADRKRISLTLDEVDDELRVAGDRELMEYACYNLLTNAVKYSPQRTEVRISGWKDNGHIRVAVKDQGIGMDPKEVRRIFQKFYRTKRAEESGEAGTGIGLAIVQQIVEQHGGAIEVVSRPGAGSCFTLVLPAAAGRPLGTFLPNRAQQP